MIVGGLIYIKGEENLDDIYSSFREKYKKYIDKETFFRETNFFNIESVEVLLKRSSKKSLQHLGISYGRNLMFLGEESQINKIIGDIESKGFGFIKSNNDNKEIIKQQLEELVA